MDYNSTSAFYAARSKLAKEKETSKAKSTSTESIPGTPTSASLYTPLMTLVLPDTTVTSALTPTTPKNVPSSGAGNGGMAQAAAAAEPTPTVSLPAVVAEPAEHGGTISAPGRKSVSSSSRRVDMEKVKFRIVFILWPVLIGVSMAL